MVLEGCHMVVLHRSVNVDERTTLGVVAVVGRTGYFNFDQALLRLRVLRGLLLLIWKTLQAWLNDK